ncbi:endo-1,4-beta-xylanase [Paenibacillus chondroitinus]|uniref:Endo-1,4-beta-xylanase n=1 Tax=Paenibacillus chondroitinus TaxID=59842 RepID=A0ABU6DCQ6_9BACL|nr:MULTISPECIES: endo-1,4-beta-xylanase [Paenibacillus]MCY9659868.1 endo-1,4-beta-xylanase [Paenibacillus anseongense]MEB4795514.1 endo-1,4-beta-xylanase [Paenibacillus chondroitinus]
MNREKTLINVSRILVVIMLYSFFAFATVPVAAAGDERTHELNDLIAQAEALKAGNKEFPLQISQTDVGSDVNKAFPWVYDDELQDLDNAIEFARNGLTPVDEAITSLESAIVTFTGKIKADGSNPYFRLDPGPGKIPVKITAPTNVWTSRTPLDNRVPTDFAGGTFKMIPYPFADSKGKADVLQINYVHNGKTIFGGMSLQSPLSPSVDVPAGSTIEFDVYYPKSAQGKFMRWRIRNAGSDIDTYLREYEYNNLNPDWIGSYNGETWLLKHTSITATTGTSSNFILELHGENGRPAETGMLLVANIQITAPDPNGVALPNVVNKENQSVVSPLKNVYNRQNGTFMVGTIGTGAVTGTRANHYEIFVDGNNLKADATHPRGPNWLKSTTGEALSGATTTPGVGEFSFPTSSYQAIRDSGTPGQYKSHAHVLAWYNQAPAWMRQMIPATLPLGYNGTTNYYGLGNGVTTTVKVDKEMARRVQFNHTMYVMRHFLTTDTKYGSSVSRGVIPFNSWDVLNEEVHESRHSETIPADPNSWRQTLKNTNWLSAMSDDLIGGDISEHYIYLLFKYAHIAAPNATMAAAYKANYTNLPEYMKVDGHDNVGSIDAYIVNDPPKLTYNDYDISNRTKARTVYNMVRALNTAWLSDPLYDGRPLIEDIGIQGHDSIGKTLASDNQYAMALYASLIDEGLLSGIAYSELDLKIPTTTPGGGSVAPAVLNVKQSDALGYEYALMYKLFNKFAPYIDHIISWGVAGSGWQGSYVLFDSQSNANAGYYGAVNPDRFVLGHSYLDDFFDGEYEKLQNSYAIDLGDLGIYTPGNGEVKSLTATISANNNVTPESTFTAAVSLDSVTQSVYAQDITLSYDSTVFDYASVAGATTNIQVLIVDTATPGKVRIISVNIGGVAGTSTPVLNITFKVKSGIQNTTGTIAVSQAKAGGADGTVTSAGLSSKTISVGSIIHQVDKTALNTAITSAQTLYNSAVVGTQPGQYLQAAKDALHEAINTAIAVRENASATQAEVDSALSALNASIDTFKETANKSADINGDGDTNVGDLAIVAYHYGKNSTSTDWAKAKVADMNNDNKIDIWDLGYVATNIN